MFKKIGFSVAKRPWIAIITWLTLTVAIVAVALVGVGGQSLFDRLLSEQPKVASESTTADKLMEGSGDNATEAVLLIVEGVPATDTYIKEVLDDMTEDFDDRSYIDSVISPSSVPEEYLDQYPELEALTSDKGFVVIVNVKQSYSDKLNEEYIQKTVTSVETFTLDLSEAGAETSIANATLFSDEIVHQASQDLKNGELISLPLALIVLVLVFGGFLAAGMPLVGAGVSIIGGMGVLFGASFLLDIDTTVLNVLSVIGLGLSIDYGLLMISRFRETLRAYPEGDKKSVKLAVADTMNTAGRTVFFSGLTIAICTSALVFFEASIMKSIAISAGGVIILAVIASITLLPAIFTLLGYRLIRPSFLTKIPGLGSLLKRFGDVAPEHGFFSRLTGLIQKAPAVILLLGTAFLILLGSSITSLHVSNYGTPPLSQASEQTKAFDKLEDYDAFKAYDLTLVIKTDKVDNLEALADEYTKYLDSLPGVSDIAELNHPEGKDYATLSFDIKEFKEGQEIVAETRTHIAEAGDSNKILVTGDAARDVDFNNSLLNSAWLVILIIVITTFILLFLMTGSIFIPLKAILLSALSLGAAIGVITWGFEGGGLAEILNFDSSEIVGISPLILVLILVFGFGLAMDYEVFLVSRIKEEYDKSGDPRESVKKGLQGSGRIITSAGIIIVLVFLGFAFGNMLMIKQIGVALATAVLIDMTIVRCLLVPAIMSIFGKYAWWAPKPLKNIHARFGIDH